MLVLTRVIRWVRELLRKLRDDAVTAYSAQAVLFLIISFFPFAMLLLSLLQYLPFTQEEITVISLDIVPDAIQHLVAGTIQELYTNASGTVISITAVMALWSASKGAIALIHGLNTIYGIPVKRNYFMLRVISTLYTLVFIILLITLLAFLVFGKALFDWLAGYIPAIASVTILTSSLRVLVTFGILIVIFLLLYVVIPNRKTRIFAELPGAVVAAGGWVGFSYLYSFYIDHIGNFSLYGSLTAVVLLMLWLYFCMYILFLGAEINVCLQNSDRPDIIRRKK